MRPALAVAALACIVAAGLLAPDLAPGHIERASYWPLPAADTSITPAAGGSVPTARSLDSAVVSVTMRVPVTTCKAKARGRKGKARRRRARGCGVVRRKHARRRAHGAAHRAKHRRHRAQRHVSTIPVTELRLAPGVRVVCQPNSLSLATAAIARAETQGFKVRPTAATQHIDGAQAADLQRLNQVFFKYCAYSEIQPAVTASGNNSRVIIMPGLYTEPTARAQKTHDPACSKYTISNDKQEAGAVSYAYQFHCPNDANLVAVLGRSLGPGQDPQPPLDDRHGIPNRGACIRCNMQVEGSGPSADDVVIDAGRVASGNQAPIGAASPDWTRPASITTSSAETPDPSIWRLQRLHGPMSGIPWRSASGGCGGGLGPGRRPSTAIRF